MERTKKELEQEIYQLRVLLEKADEGSHWERRIVDRIAWLEKKLKEDFGFRNT
jgi:uncharacterized coiled-coil DUF342 family protein